MSGVAGFIQFHEEKVGRQIERAMGALPALDKAIIARYPTAQDEIGSVMTRLARKYVQVESGEAQGGIGYRVAASRLYFGIKGVAHAAALEFGFKSRALIGAHERIVMRVFGEQLTYPLMVRVGQYVRQGNMPSRPFIFRAYFDAFRPMYGILNRIIGEARKEVGLDG